MRYTEYDVLFDVLSVQGPALAVVCVLMRLVVFQHAPLDSILTLCHSLSTTVFFWIGLMLMAAAIDLAVIFSIFAFVRMVRAAVRTRRQDKTFAETR